MIVADASALLDALIYPPDGENAGSRIFTPQAVLHAPQLIDIEITHVLRRITSRGQMTVQAAEDILADLAALRLTRHPHTAHLPRIWSFRHVLTAYDAAYVALTETLDATLLTRDRRLARAADGLVAVAVV